MSEYISDVYETLYKMQQADVKELKHKLNSTIAQNLKETLKDDYYDFVDYLVVREIKDIVDYLRDDDHDPFETPDNKARNLSAAFRMIEYYLPHSDYKAWLKELMDK